MEVLVTGATGFIGRVLCERLVARGDHVCALVRPTSHTEALRRLGVELRRGDVADPVTLTHAFDGVEVVYHLAGAVKALRPGDLFRANGDGTRHVAQACARVARPPTLVYVSSLAAAGPSEDGEPRREEDPPAPVSLYGESKLSGERCVRELSGELPASIVRPPVVYGPGDREFMPPLIRMVKAGLVLRPGLREKRYSMVHVSDLVDGLIAVAERGQRVGAAGPEGVYYLDDGPDHPWSEIVSAAARAAGRKAWVVPVPEATTTVAAAAATLAATFTRRASILSFDKLNEIRQRAWICSSERARAEVGYAPKFPLEVGMADAVAWFKKRHEV